MERKYYKELWGLRFKKALELEERGAVVYKALLDDIRKKNQGHPLESQLERFIDEEKSHVDLVRELITILETEP